MKDLSFDFSVSNSGVWEDISSMENCTQHECINHIKSLIRVGKLVLGERTEGTYKIVNDEITVKYRVCTDVGEDWNDDVWKDYTYNTTWKKFQMLKSRVNRKLLEERM